MHLTHEISSSSIWSLITVLLPDLLEPKLIHYQIISKLDLNSTSSITTCCNIYSMGYYGMGQHWYLSSTTCLQLYILPLVQTPSLSEPCQFVKRLVDFRSRAELKQQRCPCCHFRNLWPQKQLSGADMCCPLRWYSRKLKDNRNVDYGPLGIPQAP